MLLETFDGESDSRRSGTFFPSFYILLYNLKLNTLDFQQSRPLMHHQVVQLFVQVTDFQLGFQIHPVIVFRAEAVTGLQTVLAHHDYGRLD